MLETATPARTRRLATAPVYSRDMHSVLLSRLFGTHYLPILDCVTLLLPSLLTLCSMMIILLMQNQSVV